MRVRRRGRQVPGHGVGGRGAARRSATRAGSSATTADEVADGRRRRGLLDVLGGPNRTQRRDRPARRRRSRRRGGCDRGRRSSRWRGRAGWSLAGGAEGNDPLAATTTGTGELIDRALEPGARTDHRRSRRVGDHRRRPRRGRGRRTPRRGCAASSSASPATCAPAFVDAAAVFAPQKGATPAQVRLLHGRLERLAQIVPRRVRRRRLDDPDGSGAAGGLAGGLAALGGRLVPGFELVADHVDLARPARRRRRRHHRRGLPRRAEPRRQGRRRRCDVRIAKPAPRSTRSLATPTTTSTPAHPHEHSRRTVRTRRRAEREPLWCIEQQRAHGADRPVAGRSRRRV